MEIHNHEQGSPEWHKVRAGIPTASKMKDLFTASHALPKGTNKTMLNYAAEMAADHVSGLVLSSIEGFQGNSVMDRGHELEPVARNEYAFIVDEEVQQVGFITNHGCGCSPDGLVGDVGGLEIKCLLAKAHTLAVADCMANICPAEYYVQVMSSLWITGRDWWDLYFYHPDLPSKVLRIQPDPDFFKLLEQQVTVICRERDSLIKALDKAA